MRINSIVISLILHFYSSVSRITQQGVDDFHEILKWFTQIQGPKLTSMKTLVTRLGRMLQTLFKRSFCDKL